MIEARCDCTRMHATLTATPCIIIIFSLLILTLHWQREDSIQRISSQPEIRMRINTTNKTTIDAKAKNQTKLGIETPKQSQSQSIDTVTVIWYLGWVSTFGLALVLLLAGSFCAALIVVVSDLSPSPTVWFYNPRDSFSVWYSVLIPHEEQDRNRKHII